MENRYTILVARLSKLSRIMRAFVLKPRQSLNLLYQLLIINRSLNYSKNWQNYANKLILPSPQDSTSSSDVNPLKSYFDHHKEGKGIWKHNHYFEIYHRHFKKFVDREVHVLEIGVYSGGSLEMWRDYFGPGCYVYGVDIEEACKVYQNDYTKIFIGDQADHKFWKVFKDKVPRIDILIDDGGHQAEQQIVTLEEMLPYLSPGGIYLCEDIHDIHNIFSSYLYGLVKNLNEGNIKPTQFQSWIKSINFYPRVAVIEKAEVPVEEFIAPKHGTLWQPFYSTR